MKEIQEVLTWDVNFSHYAIFVQKTRQFIQFTPFDSSLRVKQ